MRAGSGPWAASCSAIRCSCSLGASSLGEEGPPASAPGGVGLSPAAERSMGICQFYEDVRAGGNAGRSTTVAVDPSSRSLAQPAPPRQGQLAYGRERPAPSARGATPRSLTAASSATAMPGDRCVAAGLTRPGTKGPLVLPHGSGASGTRGIGDLPGCCLSRWKTDGQGPPVARALVVLPRGRTT